MKESPWISTTGLQASLFLIFLLVPAGSRAQSLAVVYPDPREVPVLTTPPSPVTLRSPRGATNSIVVRAALCGTRLESTTSQSTFNSSFKGRNDVFHKFVRIEMTGLSPENRPAKLQATYTISEGGELEPWTEVVPIAASGPSLVVDLEGFLDDQGTLVVTSGNQSTKYRLHRGKIVATFIRVTDASGRLLFTGGWPELPKCYSAVGLAELLNTPSRVWTEAATGRKVEGRLQNLDRTSATVQLSKGTPALIPRTSLSEPDNAYLGSFDDLIGRIAARDERLGILFTTENVVTEYDRDVDYVAYDNDDYDVSIIAYPTSDRPSHLIADLTAGAKEVAAEWESSTTSDGGTIPHFERAYYVKGDTDVNGRVPAFFLFIVNDQTRRAYEVVVLSMNRNLVEGERIVKSVRVVR